MTAVASVLADHVAFQLDSVDRLFIAGYVPELQHEGGLVRFLIDRGYRIPSPAGLGHNHDRLVSDIEAFVAEGAIPLVRFGKGESKEEAARPYLLEAAQQGREGVVLVGKAQERVAGWRGFKDRTSALHSEAHPHFTYRRQALFVDHFYFYIWDAEWGPGFVKLCPYAPYGVWAYVNGHEWAKRQLAKAGVGFVPLDNGLRSVDDPPPHLRPARPRPRPGVSRPVASPPPLRPHPTRPQAGLALPVLHPPDGDLPHRRVRSPGLRTGLVRGRHPRAS